MAVRELLEKLGRDHRLTVKEYASLLQGQTPAVAAELQRLADRGRRKQFGSRV